MKTTNTYLLYTALALAALALAVASYQVIRPQPRYGYVELTRVYEGFDLKKELESKFLPFVGASDHYLDSLKLLITSLEAASGGNQTEEILQYKYLYQMKNAEFEQQKQAMVKDYDQQVWSQINQYMGEFGEENHYEFIFGAAGTGSVMYARKNKDITEQVIIFINRRYHGQ